MADANYIKLDPPQKVDQYWFQKVWERLGGGRNNIIFLPEFTVATVPEAADNKNGLIIVSDETGGRTVAFSDGTDWKRVQDLATIS